MEDMDDIQLKSEIDDIMRSVNNIMNNIEELSPQEEEAPGQPNNVVIAR